MTAIAIQNLARGLESDATLVGTMFRLACVCSGAGRRASVSMLVDACSEKAGELGAAIDRVCPLHCVPVHHASTPGSASRGSHPGGAVTRLSLVLKTLSLSFIQ